MRGGCSGGRCGCGGVIACDKRRRGGQQRCSSSCSRWSGVGRWRSSCGRSRRRRRWLALERGTALPADRPAITASCRGCGHRQWRYGRRFGSGCARQFLLAIVEAGGDQAWWALSHRRQCHRRCGRAARCQPQRAVVRDVVRCGWCWAICVLPHSNICSSADHTSGGRGDPPAGGCQAAGGHKRGGRRGHGARAAGARVAPSAPVCAPVHGRRQQ